MKDYIGWLFILFVVVSMLGSFWWLGYKAGQLKTQVEAVELRYGEWIPDTDGHTYFIWKEHK